MGMVLDETPPMGEFGGEVRSESFYLRGEYNGQTDEERAAEGGRGPLYRKRRHAITVYENGDTGQGTVEILIEDIPKVRAVLDAVEAHATRGGEHRG